MANEKGTSKAAKVKPKSCAECNIIGWKSHEPECADCSIHEGAGTFVAPLTKRDQGADE